MEFASSDILNCACVRVKEEPSDASLIENDREIFDEAPDFKNVQLLPFLQENSPTHILRKYDENHKNQLDDAVEIIAECEGVHKPYMVLSSVKTIDDYSSTQFCNVKDNDSHPTNNAIKIEPAGEVKQECDDAGEWNSNFDRELNDDMEIVVECEDVKPSINLLIVKRIEDC
ncbi:hypothetical protein TKK_0004555 [Trichogramma kaykai]